MLLLKDKVAVITGATRGIGKAIAIEFAKQGALLVLSGTNNTLLRGVKKEIRLLGGESEIIIGDIASPHTSEKIVDKTMNTYHKIDILVNNAGIITRETTEKMSLADWHKVMNINLNGVLFISKKVIPIMKKQKSGKIVNISSRTAIIPSLNSSPSYGASKAGILYLTRHFALELGPFGINVNAVCPGPIETDMHKYWSNSDRKKLILNIPLHRVGKPEEVAQLVLFLASDLSKFITGETININGGISMI